MKFFFNKQQIFFSILLLISSTTYKVEAQVQNLPDFTKLVEQNGPAVVNISTTQKVSRKNAGLPHGFPPVPKGSPFEDFFHHFFGNPNEQESPEQFETHSLGSGFVISSDGYIITNYHVIRDADAIIVRFSDRRELEAKVVGSDARSDLGLLKVEAGNLPTLKYGDSNQLKVGEWVLAIGSPFGFDYSATAGIVSAVGRSLPEESYIPFIQTDVAINPGNSGGPLFNLAGEVIGINSQIYSRTGGFMGLSFAIPIDVAMRAVEQLKENGQVTRGWLGVIIQDVTQELAESFGLEKPQGALVAKILPDSPAAKAGVKLGDIILSFNNKPISRSSSLPPLVGQTKIGDPVSMDILREGKQKNIKIKVGKLPEEEELQKTVGKHGQVTEKRLAIEVSDLTGEQKAYLNLSTGVQVTEVKEGPALDAGIQNGDIILKINSVEISDIKQFQEIAKKLPSGKKVPVLIQRGENTSIFIALKVPN
ncbi:DegQ family serine endoprotease [Candidatus Nitrosacidococcus tergens]|uniref:Probable periplasmic serine endoprotease DegP-like n=1 Tax=Candidatus Nitrosacidococcus tergens TaxID=553981 RepID=A0A7G1QAV6_9GAMM|nr:DegQ family serine endoprotease [Candidatus Nitrosacidococcus tergens]CAB1276596.1 putative periplasmic serine endoprotease DegP-like [Candidatus Nitrosacidococcus tergens]